MLPLRASLHSFLSLPVRPDDLVNAKGEIVENLSDTDEAEAHAKAHETPTVGNKGDGRYSPVSLELCHIGVPEEFLNGRV